MKPDSPSSFNSAKNALKNNAQQHSHDLNFHWALNLLNRLNLFRKMVIFYSDLRARFARWWQERLPLTDQVTLTQRNVYIVPSLPGWMLAATILVLLLTSINYQLNLGYMLTFLLGGCVIVGMYINHNTLRGLSMRLLKPEPCFCKENATLEVQFSSENKSPRYGIGLAVYDSPNWVWCDVPAQGSCSIQVSFEAQKRGYQTIPALTVETRFPLGTFRVWTIWRPLAQLLVYPEPEAHPPPLPLGELHHAQQQTAVVKRTTSSGEFDGVRAYRRGDTLRQVIWKKAAKSIASGQFSLVSRDHENQQEQILWLDYQTCSNLSNQDARLSRLCAWVLLADRLELEFGLRLPNQEIEPATGYQHRLRCLEALALC